MNKYIKVITVLAVVAILVGVNASFGQPFNPPDGSAGGPVNGPVGAPIDGGISALIAAGVALVWRKYFKSKKKTEEL